MTYNSVPRKLRTENLMKIDEMIKGLLLQRKGHVTKDEEAGAETLYALADMFSAVVKVQYESKKMDTRIIVEAACRSSDLANPTAHVIESESSNDAEQPKLETSKQSALGSASQVQSCFSPIPREKIFEPDVIQSCEKSINWNQVPTSWKKCRPTRVRITHLIKVLRKSEASKELLQKPTQRRGVNVGYHVMLFNAFTQCVPEKYSTDDDIARLTEKRILQDQHQESRSHKQGSDFSSLAAGGNGSNTRECLNRAGYSLEALKQLHGAYSHPQNLSATQRVITPLFVIVLQLKQQHCRYVFLHMIATSALWDIKWSYSSSRNGLLELLLLQIYVTGKTGEETQLPH